MKHDLKVTIVLLSVFLATQLVGLFVVNQSIESIESVNGTIVVTYIEPPTGRPDIKGSTSFYYIMSSILIGTLLVLVLIRFRLMKVWKVWFFLAVGLTLTITFAVFIRQIYAFLLGFMLAYLKIFKPNLFTHNITEIFMYSGIAVLLVPIIDVFWMIMILVAISVYDVYAVWKSKHMVKMAKFQAKSKLFAGLLIPYKISQKSQRTIIKQEVPSGIKQKGIKSAILGGGDVAFPLLFAGTVMDNLIKVDQLTKQTAFFKTLIIPVCVGIALFFLLMKGKKDKFYPAMPVVTGGCLIGYWIVMVI